MKSKCSQLLFLLLAIPTLSFSQTSRPAGINLSGVVDWSTELVFTDAFKQAREWTVHEARDGAPWDSGVSIPLQVTGFPLEIPYSNGTQAPQAVRALLLWDLQGHYPSGKYRLMVTGSGRVRLWGAANGTFQCPVDTLVTVNAANGGVVLEIERSVASNPIKAVKFIYPKYVNTWQNQVFTTEFLDFVKDFQTIRFMDWLRTNNSEVKTWAERTPMNHYTQTKNSGVAWEYIIELCNITNKNAWINIPHQANDQYMQELAKLLKEKLNPNLKIYLEYSNEVWNGIFSQHAYAGSAGLALGYSGEPWVRAWKYTAKRSADLFYQFERVFGQSDRLVKVIPCFGVNDWITNELLTYFNDPLYNPQRVKADAIAIAPYFGGAVADQLVTENVVNSISTAQIVARIKAALPESFAWMNAQKAVADKYGLKLLVYEGGSHVVATGANVNNDALTNKLIAANRDAGLQELYCAYSQYWYNTVKGDLFCFFSSHGLPSKWGSWGMKEYMNQTEAPKYKALKACVFSAITTRIQDIKLSVDVSVYPNPTLDGTFLIQHSLNQPTVRLYDALGRQVDAKMVSTNQGEIRVQVHAKGIVLGVLQDEKVMGRFKVLVR
ncbi:T9SS type A sorting domain-containing protein [Haliscomenobacter hydrossis]|uniref:Secretion system C-terminal sorting domain-containing protein n=1 Tax=Haliscomenobacter hydrossis (strain ATCC 27775 / DSM 1100 / LMG 10767 / O) TaxID=760192 RepID=F4L0T0_HALH1|nr:T9SS type A sorting domain-containing protein [Haliscomenobacter hydrossis]AEE50534.1 hypothetical protein Halhy_2665 [Haliscomenobacter hydrossis DSM 1100]